MFESTTFDSHWNRKINFLEGKAFRKLNWTGIEQHIPKFYSNFKWVCLYQLKTVLDDDFLIHEMYEMVIETIKIMLLPTKFLQIFSATSNEDRGSNMFETLLHRDEYTTASCCTFLYLLLSTLFHKTDFGMGNQRYSVWCNILQISQNFRDRFDFDTITLPLTR